MDLQCIFEACGYEKAGENHDDDDAAAAAQHLGISWNYLGRRAAGSCAAASGGLVLPCPFPVEYT